MSKFSTAKFNTVKANTVKADTTFDVSSLMPAALMPAALLCAAPLCAAVWPAQAAARSVAPPIVSISKSQTVSYDTLYTEADWQRVQLPDEAVAMLGDLGAVKLSSDLPANVRVALSTRSGPGGTVGLSISRSDKKKAVRQMGEFTLTNPATGESYTFAAMVTGGVQ
ncbi:hypothetical protein [Deinococcus sp.]|uniref:hypothetical protein n=1 Tax=Deinococcus sp. TaxID=47478 RepID=UPI0025E9A592|nr:hypothetical protein [Deinococcus sp.]